MDNKFAQIKPHFSSSNDSKPAIFKLENKQEALKKAREIIREAKKIREEHLSQYAPIYPR